jgi:hypothetical protein
MYRAYVRQPGRATERLKKDYWLYAVYDCATPASRLVRVQDPFDALLAKAKGGMLISARQGQEASSCSI